MWRRGEQVLIVFGAILLFAAAVGATIIQVPADQSTVQGALDVAANGDTVLVAPGHYYENVNFRLKQVVLASMFLLTGDPADIAGTILDGSTPIYQDTASVIIIAGGQDSTTAVIGFTITGGRGTKWRDVSDNKIYREGGGILTEACSPLIMNNVIINNRANEKGLGVVSAGGGGIRCGFGPLGMTPYLVGNVFAYNQGLYGGGMVSFHCPVVVTNNVFWKNSGGQDFGGAGLWIWNNSEPSVVVNNTIIGNSTVNQGGGIYLNSADADLRNNIIRGNTGSPAQVATGGGVVVVSHNNIQGGYPGVGNVDDNPQFAPSNFYLSPSSPCVDSGDALPEYNDREDPVNAGVALFPALGTLHNDKGAYGGLLGRALPLFTSPQFSIQTLELDFGTLPSGSTGSGIIYLQKEGFGPVVIDSIRLGHTSAGELYCVTRLPFALQTGPSIDSLPFYWTPEGDAILLDTFRIYHSDTTAVSPILAVVRGKITCCVGTRGNVDGWGRIDLSDLSYLIAYLTTSPQIELPCQASANVNGVGIIDLSDLSRLIAYLTLPPGSISLLACP